MGNEIHFIGGDGGGRSYSLSGVPIFQHPSGIVPAESMLAASDDTDPFPTLGGGYGSSIVRLRGLISHALDAQTAGIRRLSVNVAPGDAESALSATAELLGERDGADYIVILREVDADG
ncbi:hypothetical protein [Microbacterium hominis]|uniref:Uncharacterized protein n=1 Tax=Microbacterium hominis TaxID=162426 RepID=A0A7D4Q2D6_9MICO|nr:hypothetical protein [Microbacterium hominis]QKJ20272.1 hypothetical protein HQM25_13500 [Microbacterium hominis]